MSAKIKLNDNVQLIISDVDETIADLYLSASHEMIKALEKLLGEGKVLFLISGQSIQNIQKRIVNHIRKELRKQVIVGSCSGAEVWGFDKNGDRHKRPFYSLYKTFSDSQEKKWRKIIEKLTVEFGLEVLPTMPISEFKKKVGNNPLAIMLEDRGAQITFEVVNDSDLRIPILERAKSLLKKAKLPITPRLAGVFALDFAIKGVSKTTAVKYVIKNKSILSEIGLNKETLKNPKHIEVWGDKFSKVKGGTDRHISEALPKEVRSITFRDENPAEFLKDYNIVVWHGKKHLHNGLLEFLKSR